MPQSWSWLSLNYICGLMENTFGQEATPWDHEPTLVRDVFSLASFGGPGERRPTTRF